MVMPLGLPSTGMTAAEYLAWERTQPERHEYFRGEVFLMAGGSPRHNALAAAIIRDLGNAALGTSCRVLTSDQRIVTRPGEHYVYADASLLCGSFELAEDTSDVLANPRAIFEVLSRSTEAYDRGEKWAAYRRIPSLTEYFLVAQSLPRIECYKREGTGWHYDVTEAGGRIVLGERFELQIDALYDGVFELPGE
jgi:Uma2 family endonuclease